MIGLESCFGAVNKIMVHDNNMKLTSLVKRLTVNPRRIMGINQDLFKLGSNAEIAIFDPDLEWIFSNDNIFSKSHNSPFINQKLKGKIKATIVKGHITTLD